MPIPIIDPAEPPRDRARRHLVSLAHRALAELVDALVTADARPVSATAACRRSGVRVVVRLMRYDGPAYEPAAACAQAISPIAHVIPPAVGVPLRDVEATTFEAAPAHDARPVSVRQLARLAGYRDSGHFREAVNQLLERGLLVRIRGGVRRANPPRQLHFSALPQGELRCPQ
jgi:hypothetical protein